MRCLLYVLLVLAPCVAAAMPFDDKDLAPIQVASKKNAGNLPYTGFFALQTQLQSYLPREPRQIDLVLRLEFNDRPQELRDAYLPLGWGVAIVGQHLDVTVPLTRGGYFLLPDLPEAREEDATIMFNAQTRKGRLGVTFAVRVPESHSLPYQALAQAFAELTSLQMQIPSAQNGLQEIKLARFDALKACYAAPAQPPLAGQAPLPVRVRGRCQLFMYDQGLAHAKAELRFADTLETLTMEMSGDW